MKILRLFLVTLVLAEGCRSRGPVAGPFSYRELAQFKALEPIDAHTHIYKSDPAYFAMLEKLHVHILDIVILVDNDVPERRDLSRENKDVLGVVEGSDGNAAMCTTFDAYQFNQPDFAAGAIRQVDRGFQDGAVAAKIWKNIGMEIKDVHGNFVMPDDPSLEPVYRDIVAHHKTLISHVADTDTAWAVPNPAAWDHRYFASHPEWSMYSTPHAPSKEHLLRARDHVLEMNPDLKMVGAHLGSMEGNLGELAQHLDRYPNFAVDLSGRMRYFMAQPRSDMIAFFTRYQDRLIYGTDDTLYAEDDSPRMVGVFEASYARHWRFLATSDVLKFGGHEIQGLSLPEPILRKIYHDNAVRWFPDILTGQASTRRAR